MYYEWRSAEQSLQPTKQLALVEEHECQGAKIKLTYRGPVYVEATITMTLVEGLPADTFQLRYARSMRCGTVLREWYFMGSTGYEHLSACAEVDLLVAHLPKLFESDTTRYEKQLQQVGRTNEYLLLREQFLFMEAALVELRGKLAQLEKAGILL